MVELLISVLITLGTVIPGTNTTKKGTTTTTSSTTVVANGGTSTWTNGGLE